MNAQQIMDLEKQYVVHTYNRPSFVLDHGKGAYLYDTEGKAYLDFLGGIAVNALGHQHPAVVKAIQEQAVKLLHVSNLYHTAPQALLARDLVENSTADRVYFCNSGTEAVEACVKFARKWGKQHGDKTAEQISGQECKNHPSQASFNGFFGRYRRKEFGAPHGFSDQVGK